MSAEYWNVFHVTRAPIALALASPSASAAQAIETIVLEGEGCRGDWQGAHFGRFLNMLEDYRALAAADPSFSPARPAVTNPYVRVPRDLLGLATATGPAAPDDPRGVHLIQDRYTAAVSDLFNACYAAMLQLLYRFFQHSEETDAELRMLGETAVQMMRQVIRPLGELLTRLPVGPHAPGMTAGPSFMLTSATPVTPHKPAAWLVSVAKRRAIDHFRRSETRRRLVERLGEGFDDTEDPDPTDQVDRVEDDVLRLVYLACHPVLPPDARAALTLRLVCGLTTTASL